MVFWTGGMRKRQTSKVVDEVDASPWLCGFVQTCWMRLGTWMVENGMPKIQKFGWERNNNDDERIKTMQLRCRACD